MYIASSVLLTLVQNTPGSEVRRYPASFSPVEYKPDMAENDPKALFQQQIPKSFLDLQDAIRQAVASCHHQRAVPIMQEEEFKWVFLDCCT